jgi:diguanylate cyclase (GGDEF)-like protein
MLPCEVVVSGVPPAHPTDSPEEAVVVLRPSAGDNIYFAGTVLHVEGDLNPAAVVATWRDRRIRMAERNRLPERLIAFFRELHRADDQEEVRRIVSAHVVEILGGRRAWIVLKDGSGATGSEESEILSGDVRTGADEDAQGSPTTSFPTRAGLIAPMDLTNLLGEYAEQCGDLLEDRSIGMVAHTPIGTRGWLLLGEHRGDRVFWPDEWEILAAIGEQAEQALLRIGLLENTRKLSLTDPLTGLANRRHMDLAFRHAWSAAQRGEGLALLMLDLDRFKELNDTRGHDHGDKLLRMAADVIRGEARGADVVVRYGGDEFLVIMPRATARGARALAARIRERLARTLSISAGIAVYRPSFTSAADLLKVADLNLYRSKARRTSRNAEHSPLP